MNNDADYNVWPKFAEYGCSQIYEDKAVCAARGSGVRGQGKANSIDKVLQPFQFITITWFRDGAGATHRTACTSARMLPHLRSRHG